LFSIKGGFEMNHGLRAAPLRLVSWSLLLALLVSALSAVYLTPHPAKAATGAQHLLLVHGFTDSCAGAFNTLGVANDSTSSAYGYFTAHGWAANQIDEVGYYNNDAGCTSNVTSEQQLHCSSLVGGHQTGWTDDPINHLACMFAWYVNDTYPTSGPPVIIVAHSMGGLIVRAAIGESGQAGNLNYNSSFPQTPLNVVGVITVGTPHGGLDGVYLSMALQIFGNPGPPEELLEMEAGSPFMTLLTSVQDPQGANGTYWALMAASILPTPKGAAEEIYPAGDAVVKADNALTMSANFKILYGQVWCSSCESPIGPGLENTADQATSYVHEIGLCDSFPILKNFGLIFCNPPFYLNDDSTGQTKAWICSAGCTTGTIDPATGGGIKDVHVFDTSNPAITHTLPAQPTLHSLAMITALTQSINLAWQNSGLGASISWENFVNGGLVSYFTGQVCAGGYPVSNGISGSAIFWSVSTLAHEVYGCIYHEYEAVMGGPSGKLGYPISDETGVTGGRVSYFAGQLCGSGNPSFGGVDSGSAIFYNSSNRQTNEVHGCIYHEYEAVQGGPTGSFGFPTWDEIGITGVGNVSGRVSYFAGNLCSTTGPKGSGSAIYYGGSAGTHEVHGCIYHAYWSTYGGPAGNASFQLGFPTWDEIGITGIGNVSGRVSYFANNVCVAAGPHNSGSAIYWNGSAHEVQGCIYHRYLQPDLNGPAGCLGFPTSDEFTNDSNGDRESNFQHGYIVWYRVTGAIAYSCD
jgi:uncharacterized protein with LGFP repeats/pimeloyl-ACP methyl ester carboxylesterase